MNIGFITSTFLPLVGGAEIAVHNLACALHALRHRVVVVAPRLSSGLRTRVPYELRAFPPGTLTLLHQSRALGGLYSLATVAALRREKFDVINVHGALPWGPVMAECRRLLPAPVMLTFRGSDLLDTRVNRDDPLPERAERRRLRSAAGRVDGVVVLSDSMRAAVQRLGRPRRVFVIPNGIHWQRFAESGPAGRFRAAWDIPEDAPVLLAVGRNHPTKNLATLVRAMRTVVDGDPRVRCIVIGRGVRDLGEPVAALGLGSHITLIEQIGPAAGTGAPLTMPPDALLEAYRSATLFVSTSQKEGWPNALAEALAAGVPAVVSDAPGNRDVVKDGVVGLLYRPGDPGDLAAKILTLLRDAGRRQIMSRNAAAASRSRDWPEIAKQYVAAYETVLQASSPRPPRANAWNASEAYTNPSSRS